MCSLSNLYLNVDILLVFCQNSVSYRRLTTKHVNILRNMLYTFASVNDSLTKVLLYRVWSDSIPHSQFS